MERKIHSLVQGSAEWLAHRAQYFNASDAPAMMGVSPYKTRSELLHEKATGVTPDVDDATQRRFDDGHRFEALARPLAEEIIGTDLYPVSVTLGKLAASLDGLTMVEDVSWEHKSLNNEIRAASEAADLPIYYHVQMEQQQLVSGAEKTLFQGSTWDAEGNLIEERHFWYESNPELRQRIIDGWIQFEKDLADYQPREIAEKPKAEAIMALPALAVQIRGEVLTSNLPVFKSAAEKFIAEIKMDLKTDEDFVQADATVKFCDAKEKEIGIAMDAVIAQMASIDELMRTGNYVKDQLRTKRLALSKQIETRKVQIKENAVAERRQKYADHVAGLNKELGDVSIIVPVPDFVGAIKGLKTIASLYDKLDTALANGKIAADAAAKDLRAKLDWYKPHAEAHGFLFRDLQAIIQKPADDFQLAVTTRVGQHEQAEAEKAKQAMLAEHQGLREQGEYPAFEEALSAKDSGERLDYRRTPHDEWRGCEANHEMNAHLYYRRSPQTAPAPIPAKPEQPAPWLAPARTTAPSGTPSLRLGQINERLAPIALTADGLASLGFTHAATDKAAKLYHEETFPKICAALIRHIESRATESAESTNRERVA